MKLNTRNYLRTLILLLFSLLPATTVLAQFEQEEPDPFADDPFEIDQPVVRRNVRRGAWT